MGEYLYNALTGYYSTLEKFGYMSDCQVEKLIVLNFLIDFVTTDYRGILSKDDYRQIENALECLYGTSCLIPYPDYLKMGKLHLGEVTELAQRVKVIEDTEVLKAYDGTSEESDVMIVSEEEE